MGLASLCKLRPSMSIARRTAGKRNYRPDSLKRLGTRRALDNLATSKGRDVASQKRLRWLRSPRENGRRRAASEQGEGARRDDDANKQQRGDGEHASQACCPDARPVGRPTHSCAYAQRTRTAVLASFNEATSRCRPTIKQRITYATAGRQASVAPLRYRRIPALVVHSSVVALG
uniref:Uncharacterized protein n=1 Tax=Plectus sambesii TaxID=2011161 RepID=A0A914XPD3_9BILA